MKDQEVFSHKEAQEFLRVSKATINRLCASGVLKRRVLGRRSLFLKADLLKALGVADAEQQPN